MLFPFLFALFSFVRAAGADNVVASRWNNPHLEIPCGKCHPEIPGKDESASRGILSRRTRESVSLCRDCHPRIDDFHHPLVKKSSIKIPAQFPLGPSGEMTCSSCHDVHMEKRSTKLLRGFPSGQYKVRMDLCLDCHGEKYLDLNPHNAPDGKERCHFCHSSRIQDNLAVSIREGLDRKCGFCHDIRRKDHPANLNLLKNLPRWLSINRTEKLLCATCHDPHGSSDTIHYLRVSYIEYFEGARSENPHGKEDYSSCLVCHLEVSMHGQEMKDNLLFGKDQILLCYSCHGEMDACHLVMIRLPAGQTAHGILPLTPDGRITCSTCHDPSPAGGCNVEIRGIGPGEPISALCLRCHERNYLAGVNPHTAMSVKTACRFCHAYMRDTDKAERFALSFISNTRVICLRCHASDTHPMGRDIKRLAPRERIPKPFRLDRKGKVTCTTCHQYHFDSWGAAGEKVKGRLLVDIEKERICPLCHLSLWKGQERMNP